MDMRLPSLDGCEVTRRIRAAPGGQEAIIVALTASTFEEERATLLACGCNDVLHKPFQQAQIYDALAQHLGIRFTYKGWEPDPSQEGLRREPLAAALAAMPSDWLAGLRQATLEGDLGWMATLISQVRAEAPDMADALSDLATNFRHDEMLQAIECAAAIE
jgi:response regulator of citrate/malate metabolism